MLTAPEMPFWAAWDFWVAISTLLLVGATVWLAIEARRSLEHSRKSSEQQLRAYVLTEHMDLFDGSGIEHADPERHNTPCIIINIKNFGQTPAYNIIHWAQIEVRPAHEENLLSFPTFENRSGSAAGPGGKISKALWYNRSLSPSEMDDITQGRRHVFVFGHISYDDAFGRSRYSKYRMKYVGRYPPINSGAMSYCDGGNDSN